MKFVGKYYRVELEDPIRIILIFLLEVGTGLMKPYIRTSLILSISIALAGCATYVKLGASKSDWQKDKTDCLVKANLAGFSQNNFEKNNFIRDCLEGQGWTKQ